MKTVSKPKPANYWKFAVGIRMTRTVTVRARDYLSATKRAEKLLDKRAENSGFAELSPVGWDLYLLEAKYKPRKKWKPLVY